MRMNIYESSLVTASNMFPNCWNSLVTVDRYEIPDFRGPQYGRRKLPEL